MIRVKIESMVASAIQLFTGRGRQGETLKNRELMQQYGFTSSPLPGSEVLAIHVGNNVIGIASADRRYNIPLVNGEVRIFTDEGDQLHFQRGGLVSFSAGTSITLTAPTVDLVADQVNLGGAAGAAGCVTRNSICAFTGGPHPDASTKVLAQKT